MDVRPGAYNASFILSDKARNSGTLSGVDVSLRSNDVWYSDIRHQHIEFRMDAVFHTALQHYEGSTTASV